MIHISMEKDTLTPIIICLDTIDQCMILVSRHYYHVYSIQLYQATVDNIPCSFVVAIVEAYIKDEDQSIQNYG